MCTASLFSSGVYCLTGQQWGPRVEHQGDPEDQQGPEHEVDGRADLVSPQQGVEDELRVVGGLIAGRDKGRRWGAGLN